MSEKINGKELRPLLNPEEIKNRVAELGREITRDYEGKNLLLVCILKGGFVFLADLVREIKLDVEIDFIRVSSYREGKSPGDIELLENVQIAIEDREVLLVEDLLDTGGTMGFIKELLLSKNPASFKICALIDKKERREKEIKADYLGFEIEKGFIVGYGTDYGEKGRNLPGIYVID